RQLACAPGDLDPVEIGQAHIDHERRRSTLLEDPQRVDAGTRGPDDVDPFAAQQGLEGPEHGLVVLHEDAAESSRSARIRRTGHRPTIVRGSGRHNRTFYAHPILLLQDGAGAERHYAISDSRNARATACVRVSASSFSIAFLTWVRTVR